MQAAQSGRTFVVLDHLLYCYSLKLRSGCLNIELFDKGDERWVKFDFEEYIGLEARLWKQKYVRSSNGKKESRFFIRTQVSFDNGKKYPITMSLTDRSKMKFPVLLGRRLLAGRFIVDVGKIFVLGDRPDR